MSLFIRNNRMYLIASIILLIFATIYEYFSHGIYSIYMYGAFAIPLIFMGASIISSKIFDFPLKDLIAYKLLCLTVVVASVTNGIIVIYGTTNSLVNSYFCFIAVAVMALIREIFIRNYILNQEK